VRSALALLGAFAAILALANAGAVGQLTLKWTINTSSIIPGKTFGAGHQGCQTIWDIDQDGANEIIFGTRRGDSKRLWCFDANQNLEWIYPPVSQDGLPGDPISKVSLIEVNKDGRYELCLAGRGGRLHVLDGYGHTVWTWDNPSLGVKALHVWAIAHTVVAGRLTEGILRPRHQLAILPDERPVAVRLQVPMEIVIGNFQAPVQVRPRVVSFQTLRNT